MVSLYAMHVDFTINYIRYKKFLNEVSLRVRAYNAELIILKIHRPINMKKENIQTRNRKRTKSQNKAENRKIKHLVTEDVPATTNMTQEEENTSIEEELLDSKQTTELLLLTQREMKIDTEF